MSTKDSGPGRMTWAGLKDSGSEKGKGGEEGRGYSRAAVEVTERQLTSSRGHNRVS